ncbi:MAG: hypothetical protein Q4E57_00315 [Eubacteriales bacterium]|nr:hypothetical protein [Eubacteriales bacterium]
MRNFIMSLIMGIGIFFAVPFFWCAADELPIDPGSISAWTADTDSNVYITSGEPTSGISLEMNYGYRNTAKSGHKLPVNISIANYEQNKISGKLSVETHAGIETGGGNFDSVLNRYIFNVEAQPDEVTVIDGIISVSEETGRVSLRLYDEEDNLLAEKQVTVNIMPNGSEVLIGLLSDKPEELGYFNGISIAQTALRTHTIELDPETMPEKSLELEQLDVIIISDFNINRISRNKLKAIAEWVEYGGVLLIGSGKNPDAADFYGSYLDDFSISEPYSEDVDMGMKYSKNGPDGAVLKLDVCNIFAMNGIQIMQASDIPMLTAASHGSGIMAFTAFDLCDVSEFCSQEMNYTDELISSLLGSGRIEGLINSAGSSSEIYEETEYFLGMTDPGRMPVIALYIMIAVIYIAFIGFGLYMWLRGRGLELYYHVFVIISAFVFAFAIWFIGTGSRRDSVELNYAAAREIYGNSISESGFMRISTSATDEYSVTLPAEYDIYPIAAGSGHNGDKQEKNIELYYGDDLKLIKASGLGSFAGSSFEFSSRKSENETPDITADIRFFKEEIDGKISNRSDYDLEDAAVLLYGRAVKLGTVPAHTEIELSEFTPVITPTGDPETIAAYITGLNEFDEGTDEYISALGKTRYLNYYMQEALVSYYSSARLVAFSGNNEIFSDISFDKRAEVRGNRLEVCFADVEANRDKVVWRTGISTEPSVVSGDYDTASNTSRGSAVIEYSLGTDLSIGSLYFTELNEDFESDKLKAFSGQISLYNYQSGNYELIRDKREFKRSEIRPYLSPANTIMVRYLPDDGSSSQISAFLPVPNITGTER